MNLNFTLLNSVSSNSISTISLVESVYFPWLTKVKSSSLSVSEEYISNSSAKPLPLAPSCLAPYTILFNFVTSSSVSITSFSKVSLLTFPVSQWVLKFPSIALYMFDDEYCPPLLAIEIILELSNLKVLLYSSK